MDYRNGLNGRFSVVDNYASARTGKSVYIDVVIDKGFSVSGGNLLDVPESSEASW